MANNLQISNGVISTNYAHPVQVLKMKISGNAEFEVIPEESFGIYLDNMIYVIFDNPIVLTDIFNYKGYIEIDNIIFASMDKREKRESVNAINDYWETKNHDWADEKDEYNKLEDSGYYNDNQNMYDSIIKFKRNGKTYIDQKSLNKKHSTTLVNNHKHTYILDVDGNGYTTYNNGHKHEVVNYVVLKEHKHIHKIKNKGKIRYGIK